MKVEAPMPKGRLRKLVEVKWRLPLSGFAAYVNQVLSHGTDVEDSLVWGERFDFS